jgi:hypothetical protein
MLLQQTCTFNESCCCQHLAVVSARLELLLKLPAAALLQLQAQATQLQQACVDY